MGGNIGTLKEPAVAAALAKRGLTIQEASALLDAGYSESWIATSAPMPELRAARDTVMSGAWVTIAHAGSAEELSNANPSIRELSAGTRGRVEVTGLSYIQEKVFDMVWAEQIFGDKLIPAHCRVLDCYGANGKGYVEFEVIGSPVIPIIIAIAAALVALGVAAAGVSVAILAASAPEQLSTMFIGGIAVLAILFYFMME